MKTNTAAGAIHDYYVQLDGEIARLLEKIDLRETSLLLISDHGAKRLDGGVCINEWLRREGWLVLKDSAIVRGTPLSKCDVDWTRTRAWAEGGYYARVCLNVNGREPQGIVPQEDFEKTRDELAGQLKRIPDDLGQPMLTHALKPQDIYRRVQGIPPDLIVIFGDLHWRAVGTLGYDSIYTLDNDTGPDEANHAQYGFFNWIAPSISPRADPIDIDILDVAPTMLAHLNEPIPAAMQGSVLAL